METNHMQPQIITDSDLNNADILNLYNNHNEELSKALGKGKCTRCRLRALEDNILSRPRCSCLIW